MPHPSPLRIVPGPGGPPASRLTSRAGNIVSSDPLADPEPLIRRVYSYVAYRLGEGPEAEDVTSEVFERALRGRHTYDAARGAPVSWLLGIARRCIADAAAARVRTEPDPPELAEASDLEARAVERLALAGAIAALDEREQDLLALRYGADLTARRIGEVLGMRTNAVEVALHRALERLRELIESDESPAQAGPRRPTTFARRP
jgi:RNA polymerase sigma-70 factor, ECF subfamily